MVNFKKVYKKEIAYQLLAKGHKLVTKEVNYKKKWLDVFIFVSSEKLENDFKQIVEELKNNK